MSELLERINDLLTQFDEFGFVPGVPVPDPEALAIAWRDNITKAIEELSKQSEWISVDERLPEPNEKCLIAAKWGDRVVIDLGELVPSFDIITKEESYDWLITYDWDEGEGFEITHWMPLPEAPKMKGGAE